MSEKEELFPKMTDECDNTLRSTILALENPQPYFRAKAHNLIELLYNKRCKIALGWLYKKYNTHPMLHVRKLAQEAREYEKRLEQ